jgi:hypothetical protein
MSLTPLVTASAALDCVRRPRSRVLCPWVPLSTMFVSVSQGGRAWATATRGGCSARQGTGPPKLAPLELPNALSCSYAELLNLACKGVFGVISLCRESMLMEISTILTFKSAKISRSVTCAIAPPCNSGSSPMLSKTYCQTDAACLA